MVAVCLASKNEDRGCSTCDYLAQSHHAVQENNEQPQDIGLGGTKTPNISFRALSVSMRHFGYGSSKFLLSWHIRKVIIYVCMYVCMHACMHACMDGWMHGCMDAWMHGCMDAWMHGCMDGWMDGWMDGCMHACMYVCMYDCMIV